MADDQDFSPFADDDASQLLQGLLSPATAQSLVAPPPDTPPPSKPGQSTPVTGSLATAPSQATPKVSSAPAPVPAAAPTNANALLSSTGPAPSYDATRALQLEQARSSDAIPLDPNQAQYQPGLGTRIRRGLAGYFNGGGIGGAISADYNAPTRNYWVDDAARRGRLSQDDASLNQLNNGYDESVKGYQRSLDQSKSAIQLQHNDQLQQARQKNAGILQQVANARQEAADTQQKLAAAKLRNTKPAAPAPSRDADPNYVKVISNGQIGYLPKANLAKAQARDKTLRILK